MTLVTTFQISNPGSDSPTVKMTKSARKCRNWLRSLYLSVFFATILYYYYFFHLPTGQYFSSSEAATEKDSLGSDVVAEETFVNSSSALTSVQTKFTELLCNTIDENLSKQSTKHKLVLWTSAHSPTLRKVLYTGFEPHHIVTPGTPTTTSLTTTAPGLDVKQAPMPEEGICWVFSALPRIVHAQPPNLRADQIMFGVASSKDRVLNPSSISAHWLRNSSTNFYVHIPKSDSPDTEQKVDEFYSQLGLSSYHVQRDPDNIDQTLQYARLSATMYELATRKHMSHVQWFVHLDDDTLLTSVDDYARMLDTYDPTKPLYIGAQSESSSTLHRDGRGAWGGASIAVSRAMAEQLSLRWLECTSEGRMDHSPYGDHKLDACVAYLQGRTRNQPDIKLEPSLHQLDLFGSIDGLLRSGIKWLTLHHFGWVNLFPFPDGPGGTPAKVQRIVNSARVLGSDGLFSNFLLQHDDTGATVLTNGYAITRYLVPMTILELETVEKTYMENAENDFNAALGPTRSPKVEGKEKRTYFVDKVEDCIVDGILIGSTFNYHYDRDGEQEDITAYWLL